VDNTKEMCASYTYKIFDFPWNDNFSEARNFSLDRATKKWVLWMDADDVLKNPKDIGNLLKNGSADAYYFNVFSGDLSFKHIRLLKNFKGIKFVEMIHEYPKIEGSIDYGNITIIHDFTKHSTQDRNTRNLRILQKALQIDPNNERSKFYIACTFFEMGNFSEANKFYRDYLNSTVSKEWAYFSYLNLGKISQAQLNYILAIHQYKTAWDNNNSMAEPFYYSGECAFKLGEYKNCIEFMLACVNNTNETTASIKEERIYKDYPYRYLLVAYEKIKDINNAIKYNEIALQVCPNDAVLKDNLKRLKE
jgi:glycosyltransferase involved in cell wall biosynthesis